MDDWVTVAGGTFGQDHVVCVESHGLCVGGVVLSGRDFGDQRLVEEHLADVGDSETRVGTVGVGAG